MIKYVSSVVVLSTLLVGCGGSDNDDKKPPKSSSAMSSSAPASSAPASSAPASSAAPSSVAPSSVATSSSSSSGPVVINASMTEGWRGNGPGNSGVTYIADGVSFNASANEVAAVFDVEPVNLYNAVLEVVVNVSSEFKASGANLQPFAQVKEVWGGKWCDIANADLTASTDYVATCTLDAVVLDQTVNGLQVGVQANGTPTGVVTIKSAKITLAAAPSNSSSSTVSSSSSAASSVPSGTYIPTSLDGWFVNGNGSPNQMQLELNAATGSGLNMVPVDWSENASANYKYEARFTLPAPINIEVGDVISYTVVVPQSYIDDATAVLQINLHNVAGGVSKYGGAGGGYKTLSAAGGVTAGADFVITETATAATALPNTDTLGLQISTAPSNANIKDKILIKSVSITQ